MSHSPHFRIPGSYHHLGHFEKTPATGPALGAGIFRTPGDSPSASSSVFNLTKSTDSLYAEAPAQQQQQQQQQGPTRDGPAAKRRRNATRESTPTHDWASMSFHHDEGPAGYTLAGQIETPGAYTASAGGTGNGGRGAGAMEESLYSDIDYRRAMGSKRPHDALEDSPQPTRPQPYSTTTASPSLTLASIWGIDPQSDMSSAQGGGWSAFALNTIGGVVGKVWEFCKAGAFRGFTAGGGMGYPINQPDQHGIRVATRKTSRGSGMPTGRSWCNEHDVPTLHQAGQQHMLGSNYLASAADPYSDPPPAYEAAPLSPPRSATRSATPTSPAVKRRQIRQPAGGEEPELRRNWVMVDDDDDGRASQPRGYRQASRVSSRQSCYTSQTQPRHRPSTASAAGRCISVPVSRLSTSYAAAPSGSPTPNRRPSSRVSHAGAASLSAHQPASFACPRSPITTTTFTPISSPPSRIPVPTSNHISPATTNSGLPANPFAANGAAHRGSPSPTRSVSRQSSARAFPSQALPLDAGAGGSLRGASPMHRRTASLAVAAPRRKASMPSTFSSSGLRDDSLTTVDASPRLDAEAKRIAARRAAEERDADVRMEAFNAQLRQMIREGKEALGTRVTVELGPSPTGGAGAWLDDYEDDVM